MGRFLQEDTYRGDGINLYAYCANNPVMYYDPSGHSFFGKLKEWCKKLAEAFMGDTPAGEIIDESGTPSNVSRTRWGAEHGKGNVKHNNAIETELGMAFMDGVTDLRKNRVQRDVNGNRFYAADGTYTRPDASYVLNGKRYNTNYISNYTLDDIDELNRELDAFRCMVEADLEAITRLAFDY